MKNLFLSFALVIAMVTAAHAVPNLQIYIEGSTYDGTTETWVTTDSSFKLWVLGNVEAVGTISDVKLAAAYNSSETGSISLTPTTTTMVTDPSTPSSPGTGTSYPDGSIPVMGDGTSLPAHGIYGTGTAYFEFDLGDFTLLDSPIDDYISSVPIPGSGNKSGQINVYSVVIEGFSWMHFDAYDHYIKTNEAIQHVFAPFSHDGEGGGDGGGGGGDPIPEPSTFILLGAGLAGLAFYRRKKS